MLRNFFLLLVAIIAFISFASITPAYATEGKPKKHFIKKYKHAKTQSDDELPETSNIQAGIDHIINQYRASGGVGVSVKSLQTGQMIYERNADRGFRPASTLKLFTGIAALDYLGPEFRFSTEFLTNVPTIPGNGILPGNLYIKFSGDPYLTIDDLKNMADSLSEKGIKNIQGNIIIDDTAIDRSTWPEGRVSKDKILCYAAPVTATIINRNCFNVNISPSHRSNNSALVRVNENFGHIIFENQMINKRMKGCSLDLKPSDDSEDNKYILSGCAPRRNSLSLAVALQNPNQATSGILANIFKEYGITYNRMEYGKTPPNVYLLAQNNSPPLSTLVTRMLKKSDNLIADSLLKKLGEKYFSTQGSWQTGIHAVQSILGPKTGIDFQHVVMVEGSGLSRDNSVTPNDFVKLLAFAYNKLPSNELLYQALPRSGIDGTLRNRLGGFAADRIHAKTGTIQGTSGLAGYIRTADNKMLAFAILVNEPYRNDQGSYHMLENRICEYLARRA